MVTEINEYSSAWYYSLLPTTYYLQLALSRRSQGRLPLRYELYPFQGIFSTRFISSRMVHYYLLPTTYYLLTTHYSLLPTTYYPFTINH